jgi:hypothetical protein
MEGISKKEFCSVCIFQLSKQSINNSVELLMYDITRLSRQFRSLSHAHFIHIFID